MAQKIIQDGFTFDDVLLIPDASSVSPDQVDTSTVLTPNIRLNVPLLSAPMDTVTESRLAISLAQEGGIGIIHKNMDPSVQAREVAQVKRTENGVISDPVALRPDDPVSKAWQLMDEQRVSGFPVTEDGTGRGRLVGILTRRDMKFLERTSEGGSGSTMVNEVMTSRNLVTAPASTTPKEAEKILNNSKVEKLLLVDDAGMLSGLITMRDIENIRTHPNACRDTRGRLRVGAAVGVHQYERVAELVGAEVDVIVVDTAHGHSENVIQTVEQIRRQFDIDIIAGNIATSEGARALIDAGADAIKVGIGPGSICTTRIVTGVGVPQVSAIMSACAEANSAGIPVIADGGIRQSGDIAKAVAAGASSVMLGSLLAGLDESPGELVLHRGRRFKTYRGMGSEGAMMSGSADRYGQASVEDHKKLVPEGVEGRVPYRGTLSEFVYQMVGGLRSAMGYCGCETVADLRERGRFTRVTAASMIESHPHDIQIVKESSNYLVSSSGEA
ncbi:MAG: IMP dehydrogenase [Phycisphaerae bacterium]|nr:IMP dehydrogenase [Phycisphaerae bacterium]